MNQKSSIQSAEEKERQAFENIWRNLVRSLEDVKEQANNRGVALDESLLLPREVQPEEKTERPVRRVGRSTQLLTVNNVPDIVSPNIDRGKVGVVQKKKALKAKKRRRADKKNKQRKRN